MPVIGVATTDSWSAVILLCLLLSDIVSNPFHSLFQNAKRASTAAAPLAAWVKANVKFSYVLEKIAPLEGEQNKLKKLVVLYDELLNSFTHASSEYMSLV